jgi:hypothetical protein
MIEYSPTRPLLNVISVHAYATKLRLDLSKPFLLFVCRSVTKHKVHIFKGLENMLVDLLDCGESLGAVSFPQVSGTKKYVNAKAMRQNAAKKM